MEDLRSYDWIVVNTSAGKDSQLMLHVVATAAREAGVLHRVVAVHADLGRVEWEGTKELAAEQAAFYGVRFEVVKRPQGDLLDHVKARGMWPSSKARSCTSDHKRGQISTVFTKLTNEAHTSGEANYYDAPIRILNCLGMRADESPARSKLVAFEADKRASNNRRRVDRWLPIFGLKTTEVWEQLKTLPTRHHPAYDLGMPRLSCCFCIFAPKAALMIAGKHNRSLLDQYVAVEKEIGHTFKAKMAISEIAEALDRNEVLEPVADWRM